MQKLSDARTFCQTNVLRKSLNWDQTLHNGANFYQYLFTESSIKGQHIQQKEIYRTKVKNQTKISENYDGKEVDICTRLKQGDFQNCITESTEFYVQL